MSKKHGAAKGGKSLYLILAAFIILVISIAAENSSLFSVSKDSTDPANSYEGKLIISEICASNGSLRIDENGELSDWITVRNISSETLSLNGVRLVNGTDLTGKVYEFPGSSRLYPGETVSVWCSGNKGADHADFKVASGGDTFTLFDVHEKNIFQVTTPELGKNQVYITSDGVSWNTVTAQPALNLTASGNGEVVISEIMPRAASYNGGTDYIELYNTTDKSVSLSGWYLSDNTEKLTKWQFPDTVLPAKSYLIVSCGGEGRLNTSFNLDADGETVTLLSSSLSVVDRVKYPAMMPDKSYSRLEDGTYTIEMQPTPGCENTVYGAAEAERDLRILNMYGVLINEVMASEDGGNDWLELRNTSSQPFDLSGWGLSDKASAPRKWQFPEGTVIPAGGYLGVYLSGLDTKGTGGLHTNFKLSINGYETVVLSTPEGSIVDRIPLDAQYTGIAYGRIDGRDGFYYLSAATPGSANVKNGCIARAEQVTFSVPGGLFNENESFDLELSAQDGARIFYTLDCSEPSEANLNGSTYTPGRDDADGKMRTYEYTGPIRVNSNMVVRAVSVKDGLLNSLINTQSYLLVGKQTLQVVSLVASPDDLYDYYKGIYVSGPNATAEFPYGKKNNGANFWMEWERDANVELYDADGTNLLSQGVTIRLHGDYSRAYRAKAFKVYADGRFGLSKFYGKLFPNRDYTEYKSFLLRVGGQDYKSTHFRDSLLTTLAEGTSVMYQDTNEVAMYLNGVYWGQYNMREHTSRYAICQWEGWDTDIADSINVLSAYYIVIHGTRKDLLTLHDWINKNGVDTDEKLAYVGQYIDLDNFMEFIAVQIYVGNSDYQNVKMYKSSETDNKWRFILFDLDLSYNYDDEFNSLGRFLTPERMGKGSDDCNWLFIALMKNPTWRDKFLTYFAQQLATTFSTENIYAKVDAKLAKIGEENIRHLARWDMTESDYIKSVNAFKRFAAVRPGRLLYYFAGLDPNYKKVGLSKAEMQKYFGKVLATVDVLNDKFEKVNY